MRVMPFLLRLDELRELTLTRVLRTSSPLPERGWEACFAGVVSDRLHTQ